MKSRKGILLQLSLTVAIATSALAQEKRPVDYVDPFIGTSNSRWMLFPGVTMPNGMVKLSPDNQGEGWQGGYEYSIGSIHGFSHLHGWTMGGLITMPANGDLALRPGRPDEPFRGAHAGYHSRFDHKDERAFPGFYEVFLLDPKVKVELTCTNRVGYQRYSLPKDSSNRVIIDLAVPAEYPIRLNDAKITKISDTEICGYSRTTTSGFNDYTLHFVMQFNKPFAEFNRFGDRETGAYVTFPTSKEEVVMLRTGISFVSIDQARYNLEEESRPFGWDFDALVDHNREIWNNLLSRIEVEGDNESDKVKFYTNLYRSFTAKMTMSDANGMYVDACETPQQLGKAGDVMIGGDAYWNSYWNLNLLWTLVSPEIVEQLIGTQLEMFRKTGWLSKGPAGIEYSGIMEGSHQMALMTSAYLKGIIKEDADDSYAAMKKTVTVEPSPTCGGYPGNPLISTYAELGYVPVEKGVVSKTLDYSFDDWCVAQMAHFLGKESDYAFFLERSNNWKHVLDPRTRYVRPKHADGSWLADFDVFSGNHFVEGNSWQYSLYVPHDIPGLIELIGRDEFLKRITHGFKRSEPHKFTAHAFDRTDGGSAEYYINHGNQVNMQAAYLFNYAGAPHLTQYYTRKILDTFYDTSPYVGWNGDEDEGQMGAWFVMSSLGLFEMNGGTSPDLRVDITSPLFKTIKIKLDDNYHQGKAFVIKTYNNSAANVYIQSIKLNGKLMDKNYISFTDISKGGILELHMGAFP
ncbi:GH92 family glycosyl hydrolase [Parapedobacter deserti]|uniref:GH92 family glycosyl hydrolase n=1 Tax=Parapedobacter deserti TaxID=1912957 RepID=A0ABV7JM33_9SPHI